MTQEEKARAYDEALKIARKSWFDNQEPGYKHYREFLESMFPELRESEDERIRKHIIEIVETYWGKTNDPGKAKDIAWLEKQKEQKPAEWKPQTEALEALMYAIEGRWEMIKPTSYLSRRLEDLYEGLVNNFDVDETLIADKDIEELKALKAEIEASMEQKSAEKQDYSGLNDLERAILRGFLAAGVENVPVGIIKETAQECLARMKPAEWSHDDTQHRNKILLDLRNRQARYAEDKRKNWKDADFYDCCMKDNGENIEWLESLPERFNLRPSWKPSEEQMKALKYVAYHILPGEEYRDVLFSLFKDLKKLV